MTMLHLVCRVLVQKTGTDGVLGGAARRPRGPSVSYAVGMNGKVSDGPVQNRRWLGCHIRAHIP
jgi:hypothetical protein